MRKKSLIVAILIFIIDQLIKIMIDINFSYGYLKEIISNFFYVTKIYNYGAAWSLADGYRWLLIIIAIVSFGVLYKYQDKIKNNKRNILAYGLIYGGLLGNLVDRIRLGYVIDYCKINIFNYEFPVFNLADAALVIGFMLLIYAIFKGEDKNAN